MYRAKEFVCCRGCHVSILRYFSVSCYSSINWRIATIRSCRCVRPSGCCTCSRQCCGKKLICVASSTAASSCSSFSNPWAEGMNSVSDLFDVGLGHLRAAGSAIASRLAPSTTLSMSAPLNCRSAETCRQGVIRQRDLDSCPPSPGTSPAPPPLAAGRTAECALPPGLAA